MYFVEIKSKKLPSYNWYRRSTTCGARSGRAERSRGVAAAAGGWRGARCDEWCRTLYFSVGAAAYEVFESYLVAILAHAPVGDVWLVLVWPLTTLGHLPEP